MAANAGSLRVTRNIEDHHRQRSRSKWENTNYKEEILDFLTLKL